MQVEAYIDPAFAAHDDSKLHSGVVVFVTGVLVYASSQKQICIMKSQLKVSL